MWPPLRANQNISRRAGEDTRPYGGNRPRDVGSDHPGAGMEPQQRQFLQTQGPVARREFRHPLRFCAPEGFCLLQGVTPVNGGPGKGDYEHEVLIWSRPRRRFGDFAAAGKVTRRPQAAKFPLRKEPSSGPMRASGPTKKRSIIAPSSAPFGGTFPIPSGLRPSPLDKGSRPPRGRL